MRFITIDIGTTSTKGILFGEGFKELTKVVSENRILRNPDPKNSEMDPMEVYIGVREVLRKLLLHNGTREEIAYISFSAYMHSVILVDGEGNPLTNAILWSDARAESQASAYRKSGMGLEYYRRTGTPIHPMSPLYKAMWLKKERRELFEEAQKIISIKEFVLEKMVGEYLVDESTASASGMFNLEKRDWDEGILLGLGIGKGKLSRPVPTTQVLWKMSGEFKEEIGLERDIPIVIGATDGCLANLGSVGYGTGMVITIGTSGAARVMTDKPFFDPNGGTFCYILDDEHFVLGGAINNGGQAYQWFKENIAAGEVSPDEDDGSTGFEAFNENLQGTVPGSHGVIFLPFLTGERAPYYDSKLKGAFIGLTKNHGAKEMQRAVLEGICYSIRHVIEILESLQGERKEISINGGFTRSGQWVKILSDVLGKELVLSKNYESASIGAGILGQKAMGMDMALGEVLGEAETRVVPDLDVTMTYDRQYRVFRNAVDALTPIFHQMEEE